VEGRRCVRSRLLWRMHAAAVRCFRTAAKDGVTSVICSFWIRSRHARCREKAEVTKRALGWAAAITPAVAMIPSNVETSFYRYDPTLFFCGESKNGERV